MLYREKHLSPCRSICELDETKKMCKTCLRTITEIANWSRYSKEQKLEVLENIELRRQKSDLENYEKQHN